MHETYSLSSIGFECDIVQMVAFVRNPYLQSINVQFFSSFGTSSLAYGCSVVRILRGLPAGFSLTRTWANGWLSVEGRMETRKWILKRCEWRLRITDELMIQQRAHNANYSKSWWNTVLQTITLRWLDCDQLHVINQLRILMITKCGVFYSCSARYTIVVFYEKFIWLLDKAEFFSIIDTYFLAVEVHKSSQIQKSQSPW